MSHRRPHQPSERTRGQAGFSLVEMLLGLFILSIVALGLSAMEITVDSGLDEATMRTAAVLAAQERLEILAATDYGALVSAKERWELLPERDAVAAWEVTADQPLPGMKTINLTVSFVTGAERHVNLTTVIRR